MSVSKTLNALNVLAAEVVRCRACRLALTRRQTVFARGNPTAPLVFVGEGPGREEDETGEPFKGRAGVLLNRALEAIGCDRGDVYIMNVVKCRASETTDSGWVKDRPPSPEEVKACSDFFRRQLDELPRARVAVALGSTALHALLEAEPASLAIGRCRRRVFRAYFGPMHAILVVATYHPSYLLRKGNEHQKLIVYEDMKFAKALSELDIDPEATEVLGVEIEKPSDAKDNRDPYTANGGFSSNYSHWGKLKPDMPSSYTSEFEVL